MALSPQRDFLSPQRSMSNRRMQKEASVSSMERALRTLSSPSSPVPQTPRRNDGGHKVVNKKKSFKASMKPTTNNNNSGSSEEAVKVAVRVRPLNPGGDQCAGRAWNVSTDRNAIVELPSGAQNNGRSRGTMSGESTYLYDKVFGENTNTCEIYHGLVSDIVQSVKEGVNGTVFTYGQTSSGKTFTMQGCNSPDSSVGIIQLAAKDIFQSIKEEKSDNSNTECSVKVSYVEIYNEELRDLLNDNKRKSSTSLIIREDKRGSISVDGLKEVAVKSLDQLMEVFRVGETNKSVGSTKMNDRSSRSHAILKIIIERKTVLNAVGESVDTEIDKENSPVFKTSELVVKTTSSLNLVDLAGSESVRHTGASGMQKKEGGMINQSLLTLSKVLMSLGQKNPGHISYRDSKLTRILKSSLSGNARMAVICCITPSGKYVEETRSTLQFASRAKLVKTNAVANEEVEDADLIAKLRLDGAKAKWENKKLEDRLRNLERVNANALTTERELVNLKKFVFSEKSKAVAQSRVKPRRLCFASVSFDDEQIGVTTTMQPQSKQPVSKDDMYIRPSSGDESETSSRLFLRAALDFKAKQLIRLRRSSKVGKEKKSARDKRYSLINEARSSPDVDRRKSLINQARSPDSNNKSKEDLNLKLTNANTLIDSLERQVDDLTSQKNDALDWIEELFAKSDQKDERLQKTCEERDNAIKRYDELDDELSKQKELFDVASRDLAQSRSENKQLREEAEAQSESSNKVEELYLELAAAKEKYELAQDSLSQVSNENRQLLHDQRNASIKIDDLQEEIVRLKSGRNALPHSTQSPDDMCYSTESEDSSSDLEKANVELTWTEYNQEKKALVDQIEKYEEDLSHADSLLKRKSDELDDALFSLDRERKTWLNERKELTEKIESNSCSTENKRRDHNDADNKRMRAELDSCQTKMDGLRLENTRLRAERQHLTQDFDACCQKMNDVTNELSRVHLQLQDAKEREEKTQGQFIVVDREKSGLANMLAAANRKIKELNDQIQLTKKDLQREEKSKAQLRQSIKRIQELVDALSEENAELKDKGQSLERASHELQRLLSSANAERDVACNERDKLIESNTGLLSKCKRLNNERDSAIREKESFKLRLDKIAADFEADYETVRGKIDKLLEEKEELQDKVTFLEASKASIEDHADRILERDNGLGVRHDRLKSEFKKQTLKVAELEDEVAILSKHLGRMKSANVQLSNDNSSLVRDIQARSRLVDESKGKRRVIFGFRGNH